MEEFAIWSLGTVAAGTDASSYGMLGRWQHAIDGHIEGLGFTGEAVMRLLLACLAGGLIGLEREVRGHEAGFRTFLLVSFGAALAMIVSQSLALTDWSDSPLGGAGLQVDPGRIAYGVMTGVGFLGAGTIIQRRGNVRGLTTAAGIWSVAALGLAWGFGLYVVAAFATLSLMATLLILGAVEDYLPQQEEKALTVRVPWQPDCGEHLAELARQHGLSVRHLRVSRGVDADFAEVKIVVKYLRKKRRLEFQRAVDGPGDMQLLGLE